MSHSRDAPPHAPPAPDHRSARVVIVLDHPAQQFAEAFRLSGRSTVVDTTVLYWSTDEGAFDKGFDRSIRWDIDLTSGYRCIGRRLGRGRSRGPPR